MNQNRTRKLAGRPPFSIPSAETPGGEGRARSAKGGEEPQPTTLEGRDMGERVREHSAKDPTEPACKTRGCTGLISPSGASVAWLTCGPACWRTYISVAPKLCDFS